MKLPNVFFKNWKKEECEPDMPKLGINWFIRKGSSYSPWAGGGIDLIYFGKRFDITFADDGQAYANEFGQYELEWDWSILPVTPQKRRKKV